MTTITMEQEQYYEKQQEINYYNKIKKPFKTIRYNSLQEALKHKAYSLAPIKRTIKHEGGGITFVYR